MAHDTWCQLLIMSTILLIDIGSTCYGLPCTKTESGSYYDCSLNGYVQESVSVSTPLQCFDQCLRTYGCKSYNFNQKTELCELNSSDDVMQVETSKDSVFGVLQETEFMELITPTCDNSCSKRNDGSNTSQVSNGSFSSQGFHCSEDKYLHATGAIHTNRISIEANSLFLKIKTPAVNITITINLYNNSSAEFTKKIQLNGENGDITRVIDAGKFKNYQMDEDAFFEGQYSYIWVEVSDGKLILDFAKEVSKRKTLITHILEVPLDNIIAYYSLTACCNPYELSYAGCKFDLI